MALNTSDSFIELSPFFTPGAPPPTLPIPIAQTEVGKMYSPSKLLAEEEVGPKSKAHPSIGTRFSPYPKPASQHKSTRFARLRSETPKVSASRATTPRAASSSDEESSVQSQSESGSSHGGSSFEDDDNLIPKPEGEAGRPGRGGYNLEKELGWNKKEFERVKKYVKELIKEHLNPSKSFVSQSMASVIVVRKLVTERFPNLRRYAQSWPATDLIRLQLKYSSGRARHEGNKADARAGKRLRKSSSQHEENEGDDALAGKRLRKSSSRK